MAIPVKKVVIGAVAALALSSAVATPASAWCYGCGGAGVAAGVIGGLALGAAVASAAQPHYYYAAPPYAYGGCWLERRPVYDAWGNYIGHRRIRVCE